MMRALCSKTPRKEYLVKEFCEAAGLGKRPVSKYLLDAAVRHIHKILLCDLNPLGSTTNSPRLCQGKVCCLVSRAQAFYSGQTIHWGLHGICSEMR